MNDVSQGVQDEGKGAEEDYEGDNAGVEEPLSWQHIRQLQHHDLQIPTFHSISFIYFYLSQVYSLG